MVSRVFLRVLFWNLCSEGGPSRRLERGMFINMNPLVIGKDWEWYRSKKM